MNCKREKIRKHFCLQSFARLSFWLLLFCGFSIMAEAQTYQCSDTIYFNSFSNMNVYQYKQTANTITQLVGVTATASAASAITPDGTRLYYVDGASPANLRYNAGGTSNTIAATLTLPSTTQRNAISPTGTGYFMVGTTATSGQYYTYTTGGATSTVNGPFTLSIQPSNAPAISNGGDFAFDSSGIAYLLDQTKNFYRIDFSTNTATFLGAITGMGTESPNGLGFTTSFLYASTLNNLLYRINLVRMTATLVTPTSTVTGFTQNDIASCIYPTGFSPNVTATKAWRNVTKGDPADFTVSTSANAGDTIEYRVIVRNTGTIAAGNTKLQDTIPSGLTYTPATTTLNGVAVTDSAGTGNTAFPYQIAANIRSPGQTSGSLDVDTTPATLTDDEGLVIFRARVNNPFNGTANPIPNTAQVTYNGLTGTINSNTVNTTVLLPNLTIAKSHTGNFQRGATGTYTITVTNSGTSSTVGTITVTDNLPVGLSVNGGAAGAVAVGGVNAANWTCASNAASPQIITCTSNTIISNTAPSNTSVFNFTVNVAANAAASVTNSANVTGGGEATANNTDNSASDPTATNAVPPNIVLLKACTSPANCTSISQTAGTELTYTITFTNSGGQAATNFLLTDPDPVNTLLRLNTNTDFKIGSVANSLGTTGLTATVSFSNDNGVSYTYTPVSQGGGAPVGFDRNVTHVRWTFSGTLSQIAPNNTGSISFVVRIL